MAAVFDLVNQDIFDAEVGMKQVSVRELLQEGDFEEITMYTFSAPETLGALLQPDGIYVLVDGCQVGDLNEIVEITNDTHIEVVKVVQL